MSYVDSPGFEVTFASFMRALSLSKAYSPGQIDKLFYFHDDILTLSHIPVVIDTYIWNILLCIFDFFMIYLSCPLGLFNNINIDLNNVSSSQYLYSKTWVLKSSIIGISITLVLLIYYWGSYIRYIPHIRILSELKATILYATLVYLPLLFVPLCGLTFGSVLVANIEHEFSQFSLTSTSFALSLIFITFLVTISLFTVSTRYSLTMRNGQFAYWRPPFSLVDYFILFLSSMFFPFRMSYEPRAATIIAVIQFLYGINYLLNLRNFPFVSIVPLTIQIKISIDIMIFSIFTVINIWIESTQIITYSIFIVISYVSTCLSLFVLTILFKNSSGKIANLNYSNLPLSKASVSMIRFAINLSMTDVTRPEIIKAIALWRFSFDLVPDIVRYCIITHQSLKDYIIPHRSYTSICIAPLQFLAFQFDFYENYAAEDDNPRVEPRVEELKLLLNQAQVILDNFWTDPSFDQMDVYALGCEIRRITNKFITIASYFPHSKAISNLWDTYTNEIVYIDFPNQLKRNNPYELLYNPHTTVYGYLVHSEVKKPVLTEKKKSNVDWYLNQITTKSTAPLAIFYGIFFVFFICVTLIIDHHSYKLTESRLDHFTNTSDFLRLLTELANEKLSFTESYAVMPSYHEISDLLGIDEETANIFSLTRIQSRSELADLVSLYTFIDNIPLPTNIGKCKEIPLFLLLKYNLPENSDADLIYCRMLYINFYSQYIARISDDIIWNYSDEDKIGKLSVGVFISIFIGISTVLFIIFLVYDERQQHKMIFTVKAISKIYKKGRNLKTKSYNIGLNILYSIIIWIIIMTLSCLLYALCEIPTQKENKKVIRLLSQVSIISKISTSAQDSLSYMEGHYINQLDIPNIVDYLTFSREELVRLIDQLLEIGFESIFQIIPPLDKWSINGSNSFSSILIDYSQLLSNQTKDTEFRFFYARYLYLFNISILISSTLPEMINKAQIEIQKISSIFIISSFVIVFLVVICMILNFFIYSRKITWYYAITTYLRRTILEECSSFHLIQKMISKQKVSNYLEELPFPFLITEIQSGIIIYSNSKIIEYIDYSTNQIIGQKLNSIFNIKNDICTVNIDNKSSILQFHFDQLDQNLQTISITDITDVYETNQTYKEMIKQMRPNIASFPVRDLMIFIKIRYDQKSGQSHIIKCNTQSNILLQSSQLATMDNNNNSNNNINMNLNTNNNNNNNNINITGINHINQSGSSNLNLIKNSKSTTFSNNSNNLNNNELDPEFLLNLFDEAENNFNGATRISCGATFYSALIPKSAIVNDHGQQFLAFLSLLTEQTENDFIAAVVFGMISCIPLDDDETRAVVCGETSNRANDCIISGNKNKIYMDDIIISSFIGDEVIDNSELLKNNLIVISPKTPPKI